ncbi:DUF6273 domain-containing protein [Bifidobacterium sp.]|jgi:hypothetical protein|uniref:DUF6273 domain-containing protein n=1 Tax=Bifidobacterium sp. TaxID=41200 RepID=UPI0025BFC9AF|nr:DUF6273 domain-containing protein [Bifidobacterium sp.]MCI1635860.1 hypothetical protein [Bifidobacterium sp.]
MGRLFVGEGRLGAIRVWLLSVVLVVVTGLVVLAGVVSPVERAVAADGFTPRYGADGYFSALADGEMPMRSITSEANARKVLFGKSGGLTDPSAPGYTAQNNGKYLLLGKGVNEPKIRNPLSLSTTYANSLTTSVGAGQVLLWAEDMVTGYFKFADTNMNAFDAGSGYESNVAKASKALDSDTYYAPIERDNFGDATSLNAVCVNESGCNMSYGNEEENSKGVYRVFPLSTGDMAEYFNAENGTKSADKLKRRCSGGACNGSSTLGSWLRTAYWNRSISSVSVLNKDGAVSNQNANNTYFGLRPAFRLGLDGLVLSADSGDQSQAGVGDVQLTFVDETQGAPTGVVVDVADVGGEWVLDLEGSSDLAGDRLGWKLVDPQATDGTVVASGNTSGGNMVLGDLDVDRDYSLYVWGQEDGSATTGWSNKATKPVIRTVRVNSHGLNQVGAGDHSVVVTGQISGGVVVTLPAGFVLDGNRAGDVSEWVGDNANLQVNTALVESDERVVVRLKDISGSPLLLSSGGRSLAYELRVNQQASLLDSQSGGLLVAAGSSDTPVSATLQARFIGGVVPESAKSGNYYGQLTFQVAVEDQS